MRKEKLLVSLLFFLLYQKAEGRPSYCDLFKCPSLPSCCASGQYSYDSSLCCKTCASKEQELCGGVSGAQCAQGMQCLKTCDVCRTVEPDSKPCIFPFIYDGTVYDKCTGKDSDFGLPWCATEVDKDDNHVIDNMWGDCAEGCPGTGVDCDEQYLATVEGTCVYPSTHVRDDPSTLLLDPTESLFPAPTCSTGSRDVQEQSCVCDRGATAVSEDSRGKLRGNCSGVPFYPLDHTEEFWCFLENVHDPLSPQSRCYEDTKWSYKDGRFWSYQACSDQIVGQHIENSTAQNEVKVLNSRNNTIESQLKVAAPDLKEVQRNDEVQISSNGKSCVFPFIYDGDEYSSCTTKDTDDGVPWCATEVDEEGHVIDNAWGNCLTEDNNDTAYAQHQQQTIDGESCVFPFKYDGNTFSECTTIDSDTGAPWCATDIDIDGFVVDGEWGDCLDTGYRDTSKNNDRAPRINEPSVFELKTPKVTGQISNELTGKLETTVKSSNGKSCIFPFKYDEETYASCTIKDSESGVPWCATGIDDNGYVKDHEWGDCVDESEKSTSEPPVTENFEPKNRGTIEYEQYSAPMDYEYEQYFEPETIEDNQLDEPIIVDNLDKASSKNSTLAVKNTPETVISRLSENLKDKKFVKTSKDPIKTTNDKTCIFPFKYEEESFDSCTVKDSWTGTPWCATGVDDEGYVVEDDWGYCQELGEQELTTATTTTKTTTTMTISEAEAPRSAGVGAVTDRLSNWLTGWLPV